MRIRPLAADAVHRLWRYAIDVGATGPHDARGRRFASMGEGSCIAFPPGAVFGERFVEIGRGTLIGPNVTLAVGMHPDEPLQVPGGIVVRIGDRCVIGRGVSIVARCSIVIEDDVTTAPNVYITDHNHSYDDLAIPIGRQWPSEDPVRIGAGSWLGTNVVVLPGTDIGRHVTVAAGSVVRGEVPDYAVVAGVPARVVRRHVEGEG
jgi:acetyltransferase-like isoleucine patch superfamily enzyme